MRWPLTWRLESGGTRTACTLNSPDWSTPPAEIQQANVRYPPRFVRPELLQDSAVTGNVCAVKDLNFKVADEWCCPTQHILFSMQNAVLSETGRRELIERE